jgi:hypothetical protein
MIGRPILIDSWLWTMGAVVSGFAFAQYLLRRGRNRVPYWI